MASGTFEELRWVVDLMAGFPRPWFIAGGWAIDLFVDQSTRPHGDIEIAILRRDQGALRAHLGEWDFRTAVPGEPGVLKPWGAGTRLELPIHEVHALGPGPEGGELEILLNESTGGVWRFRRMLEIARPISKMGHNSSTGVPYLAPEIVLLYKAQEPTDIDQLDFQNARPSLPEEASEWLRISIEACYPDHPWLSAF